MKKTLYLICNAHLDPVWLWEWEEGAGEALATFRSAAELCEEFEDWYNAWRPHMTLDGLRPDDVYYDRKPEKPDRDSKTVPVNIDQRLFKETWVTGYRLKDVA